MTMADVDEAFAHDVRDAVTELGEGDTKVVGAEVSQIIDVTDADAWRVTLILPRPAGRAWDVDKTIELTRRARQLTDEVAARHRLRLDGITSVVLTTNEALTEDIAPDDDMDDELHPRMGSEEPEQR